MPRGGSGLVCLHGTFIKMVCEEVPLLVPENRVTGWVSDTVLAWTLLGLDESFIVNGL